MPLDYLNVNNGMLVKLRHTGKNEYFLADMSVPASFKPVMLMYNWNRSPQGAASFL
jgi:hypothetical protein